MKILSLFSGIGAFEKALDYLNINYQLVNYCEIDKYASKAYSLIHNVSEDMNLGDITKVDTSKLSKHIDLITYGFPCQDISLAGKQQGMFNDDGSKTRSGLFFEALRIIEDNKPKIAIAENVKNLVSKKFNAQFQVVLQSLEEAGYNNYWKVLNAKDYGIPQNRERVFIVSIRKDIDNGTFQFPKPFKLELRLKDMLEDEVDEKYFLSDKMIESIVANNEKWTGNNNKSLVNKSIDSTINTGEGTCRCDASNYIVKGLPENTDIKLIQVGNLSGGKWDKINESCRRVYDPDGLAPTIHTCQGGNTEPKIIVSGKTNSEGQRSLILDEEGICNCLSATDYKQPKQILIREATKKGYAVAEEGDGVYLNRPQQKRGVVQKGMIQTIKCNGNDLGVVVAAAKRGREFGFKVPIIIDKNNVIIAGHTRLKAAKKLGLTDVPVVKADDLTEDQVKAFRLADNKVSEIASWNEDLLLEELKAINLDMTQFNFEEPLEITEEEDFNIDDAVDSISNPVTNQGELWKLGNHLLLCGDSTTDDVLSVMNGDLADLYLSDPPYNVAVSNSQGMTIENDNLQDSEFRDFLSKTFYQVERVLKEGGAFYVWHADTEGLNFRAALLENNLTIKQNLIWVKNQFIMGRQDYQWQHEPCLYGWKEGASHFFTKNRKQATVIDDSINLDLLTKEELKELIQTTILRFDKPLKNTDHPTMKPIPLIERLIRNSSRKGEIVLDTFGGSGTTLLASEKLERKCRMVEYDPKYVDVIIERWEQLSGGKAVRL